MTGSVVDAIRADADALRRTAALYETAGRFDLARDLDAEADRSDKIADAMRAAEFEALARMPIGGANVLP